VRIDYHHSMDLHVGARPRRLLHSRSPHSPIKVLDMSDISRLARQDDFGIPIDDVRTSDE